VHFRVNQERGQNNVHSDNSRTSFIVTMGQRTAYLRLIPGYVVILAVILITGTNGMKYKKCIHIRAFLSIMYFSVFAISYIIYNPYFSKEFHFSSFSRAHAIM
jgi:hypothetical protein